MGVGKDAKCCCCCCLASQSFAPPTHLQKAKLGAEMVSQYGSEFLALTKERVHFPEGNQWLAKNFLKLNLTYTMQTWEVGDSTYT